MKALYFMLILGFLQSAAFAVGGDGGDGDGGGGPMITAGALTANGLDDGVYIDILKAFQNRDFNRSLLDNSGIVGIDDDDIFSKFKGVNYHANGSLSFDFTKQPENKKPIEVLRVKPRTDVTRFFGIPVKVDHQSGWRTVVTRADEETTEVDWRTNWVTTVSMNDEKPTETKKVDLYKKLLEKYGEDKFNTSVGNVFSTVGAQVQTGNDQYFKIKSQEDFSKIDMARIIEMMNQENFEPYMVGLPTVDSKDLKKPVEIPRSIQAMIEKSFGKASVKPINIQDDIRSRLMNGRGLIETPVMDVQFDRTFDAGAFLDAAGIGN